MITMFEPSLVISSRHQPGHVIRRDTELGVFEEINSPVQSATERITQRALLSPKQPSNLDRLWNQKRA